MWLSQLRAQRSQAMQAEEARRAQEQQAAAAAAQAAAAAAQAAAERGPAAAPKDGGGRDAAAPSARAVVARVAPAAAEAEKRCWAAMAAAQACSGSLVWRLRHAGDMPVLELCSEQPWHGLGDVRIQAAQTRHSQGQCFDWNSMNKWGRG